MPLVDAYGRVVNYLRLSITDRCNLRCRYCMPATGVPKLRHGDVLNYEDLHRIAQAAVAVGIEKIRVTGGEPLVRKGIVDFLSRLSSIPGLKHLVLTTNGVMLEQMAADLKNAGVQRLNISIDSLRPETFARITRGGDVARVLRGIEAAEKLGFPLKLNVVAMRGVNDDEILDFAALTLERPHAVRFIEYMPATGDDSGEQLALSGEEILTRIASRFRFKPLNRTELSGPARDYRIQGALGSIGVITPMSSHFCGDCNRLRITSTGLARNCLFATEQTDLKPFLLCREQEPLEEALRASIGGKSQEHRISWKVNGIGGLDMSRVGG